MSNITLTKKQKFVLQALRDGGMLILEDITNELHFDDVDGNCYLIHHRTVDKLLNAGLIRIGHRPALDITRFIAV
jgi:hypothetical protein